MEGYRKEKSSRQHLRIDVAVGGKEGSLLLANPMTCSDIPPGASSTGSHATSNGDGGSSLLGRTSERASLRKIRPKSPSLLRFFVRGSTRKSSADDDDGVGGGGGGAGGSSGSDQDDAFSPRSSSTTPTPDMTHSNKYTEFHKASSGSVANHFATLPRKPRRRPVDSGFSSERDSVFLKDDGISQASIETHTSVSPDDDYRLGGLEALEMLHNQLQILVKQDCGEEVWGEGGERAEDKMIMLLQRQLEDMQRSLDCLQQSDHNLRLSLRLAEQRALEAETKLTHTNDRCQRLEQRYILLACKYEALAKRHKELERYQQKQAVLNQMERTVSQNSIQQYSQLTRMHSQREYDRHQRSESDLVQRPSSAQAIRGSPTLSHTETCV